MPLMRMKSRGKSDTLPAERRSGRVRRFIDKFTLVKDEDSTQVERKHINMKNNSWKSKKVAVTKQTNQEQSYIAMKNDVHAGWYFAHSVLSDNSLFLRVSIFVCGLSCILVLILIILTPLFEKLVDSVVTAVKWYSVSNIFAGVTSNSQWSLWKWVLGVFA